MRFGLAVFGLIVACGALPPPTLRPSNTTQLAAIEASQDLDGVVVGKGSEHATIVVVFASWCPHCHDELAILAKLRPSQPALRVIGVNYRAHEEYDHRGNPQAVRAYVAQYAPWLRVVPADDQLYAVLDRPEKIPTMYVYDRRGALVARYDRRERAMPDATELREVLRRLD
ncbi:MAG: TlpA disulfide reductase family protein [Kofleriaceae bacterium]